MRLLPFSLPELQAAEQAPTDLDELLYRGQYPPLYDRDVSPLHWHADYVTTYVERDVRQMVNVQDLTVFQRVIRLCAGRAGQLRGDGRRTQQGKDRLYRAVQAALEEIRPRNKSPPGLASHYGWQGCVKSAVLHAIALVHYAIVCARTWTAADSINARVRLSAENDRLQEECALLREELRIKLKKRSFSNGEWFLAN